MMTKAMALSAITFATALAIAPVSAQVTTPSTNTPSTNTPSTTMPSTTMPSTTMPSQTAPGAVDNMSLLYSSTSTSTDWRSSDLMGKAVYNTTNERIGEIEDLVLGTDGRVHAVIIGVGGFLGMGERKVAISYPRLQMMRESNGTMRSVVNASRDVLRDAPEFKMQRTN